MGEERWFVASKRADFNQIADQLHVSPILARLMRNRDLTEIEEMDRYLHGSKEDLYDPYLLKDGRKGAEIIKAKIEEGKRIRIISDYDCDGVSSNYILFKGLSRCQANVDYRIPDRVEDGYGINEHLIDQAYKDGIDTIITCDNGIAAKSQIDYGISLGMTFVVTDHHDVPYETLEDGTKKEVLPAASAVINPKQSDCNYPFSSICGAVVAYKFIQILYDLMGIPAEEMDAFLEIAAMATVCDVMPLKDENRIIVKEGLARMNHTRIVGLRALIEANQLSEKTLTGYHMGFIIGPCINASGRLSSAKDALELLLCEDKTLCGQMAERLKKLNDERKELTKKGEEEAYRYLKENGHEDDKVLIVFLPDCHESIAGIIAGRIREHYNKPVFVLTRTKEGVKGSGRSIENYHMFQEMTAVKDCFTKFGGHPMAAGLSMEEGRIEELRARLNENTSLTETDFIKKIVVDIALPIRYLSEPLIEELDLLEPYGTDNTKPSFAQKNLKVQGIRVLGEAGRVVRMNVKDEQGYGMDAIYFGESEQFFKDLEAQAGYAEADRVRKGLPNHVKLACVYYPEINEWRNRKSIQIIIKSYKFYC